MLKLTAIYAAILTFVYVKLTLNVISLRRQHTISLGDGGRDDLRQAIRSHANFAEYVPIGLILLGCLEANHIHWTIVLLLGGIFTMGRLYYAKAFLETTPNIDLRVKGMKYTLWGLQALAATNVVMIIIQKIL
ncbi:MAG: glutathione S-transferase [Candidatus Methylopumilus sp.]|nr:glutathione S-transferase [Candidatus Methylopumilus sp.]